MVRLVAVALLLISAVPCAFAEALPHYLLSPAEIAALQAAVGDRTNSFVWDERKRDGPLFRVIRHITDRLPGKHVGDTGGSVLEAFYDGIAGAPDLIAVQSGRFLTGAACYPASCPDRSAFIVDMETGHVALALTHSFKNVSAGLKDGAMTQVMKTCANEELHRFAGTWFTAWIETKLRVTPDDYRVGLLTTPCTSSPSPKAGKRKWEWRSEW